MTGEGALVWSIVRSVVVASAALILSGCVHSACTRRSLSAGWRKIWIVAALLPLFVPDLLIGFTYRLTSAQLLHSAPATEGLYAALLLIRITAFQVVVRLLLTESIVGETSIHSLKMMNANSFQWWSMWLRLQLLGPRRTAVVAWLGGCLVCFQEFETAALLQINQYPIAFTVWLFDANATGEPLSHSLKFLGLSLLFQGSLLIPAISLLVAPQSNALSSPVRSLAGNRGRSIVGIICVVISCLVFVAIPVGANIFSFEEGLATPRMQLGLGALIQTKSLGARVQQILFSFTTAAIAGGLAIWICAELQHNRRRRLTIALLLPGLIGSLALSLLLLAMFQYPGIVMNSQKPGTAIQRIAEILSRAYDSWLPMIVGQILFVLPRASLLVAVLHILAKPTTRHASRLLLASPNADVRVTARGLVWKLNHSRWLIAVAVLTHWCFWDVSIVSTLRPVRFEPIVTRLYNEMHYGRTESLITISALSMLIPFLVFCVVGSLLKSCSGRKAFADV